MSFYDIFLLSQSIAQPQNLPRKSEPRNTVPRNTVPKNTVPKNTVPVQAEPSDKLSQISWYKNMNQIRQYSMMTPADALVCHDAWLEV